MTITKRPTVRIHDIETDEIVDRPMTDEELVQYQADVAAVKAEEITLKERAIEKAAIFEKLGITEDELRIALG